MNCLLYIVWEFWLHYDIVVEMLFQIFCTLVATMAIINSEDLDFWPLVFWEFGLFKLRLDYVKYNRNPIFISFPHQSHMSIGRKRSYHSKLFVSRFRILKHWKTRRLANLHVIGIGLIEFRFLEDYFWLQAFCHTIRLVLLVFGGYGVHVAT